MRPSEAQARFPADPALDFVSQEARSDWVRLRTLLVLRWLAILGQTITVVTASLYLGLRVELGLCFLAIGASVVSNLIAMTIFPENQRLSDRDAMLTLLFDLSQLSFLLFLTGGLNNPFALLILAPVTISATALTVRSTAILGVLAVVMISLLAVFHVPLITTTGEVLRLPDLFLLGFWISIVIGIVFVSAYARRITSEAHAMSQALLATQMALAREQKLTDLGGVVAAAAHELGTPLATIKLVSTELLEELQGQPALAEDARLIREQADRCRDILRSMGRAGKDDLHLRSAPLGAVVREAAEPHADRGIAVLYDFLPDQAARPQAGGQDTRPQAGGRDARAEAAWATPETAPGEAPLEDCDQPVIWRKPEVIHGLRNLVQNAVDFASTQIWVDASWNATEIRLRITDDGPGYPQDLLGRLGDPFLSRRARALSPARPDYEGMGLGLFIAKTLLERSGARVVFVNASDPFLSAEDKPERRGAVVEVIWPRASIALKADEASGPLGLNQPFAV